jgi:hypothetical protein
LGGLVVHAAESILPSLEDLTAEKIGITGSFEEEIDIGKSIY